MTHRPTAADSSRDEILPRVFAGLFGVLLGLALVKFGNPPIMEKWVTAPTNIYEFALGNPWPILWGYGLLTAVAVLGLFAAKWEVNTPRWLVALPILWLAWAGLAAGRSVSPELSIATVEHFAACVLCFYLGVFALAPVQNLGWFWVGLLCGFLVVVIVGWQQQFGGLEATRKYFQIYLLPRMKEVPPEYLKKLSSTRVFSTLFYPNALAGVILLLLPAVLVCLGQARERFTPAARGFLVAAVCAGGLGCLFWSGSKGGWLLLLLLGLVWVLRLPLDNRFKVALVSCALVVGLAGFVLKYSGFFHRGATSVVARFDYWEAAIKTLQAQPLLGTGPGTFSIAYQRVKRPESEMARLVHNDYLEQASDSGVPAFLLYAAFIAGVLIQTAPRFTSPRGANLLQPKLTDGAKTPECNGLAGPGRWNEQEANAQDWLCFAVWLGVLGWALQGLLEFGLYIPALAWPAFAFMGLLLARAKHIDKGRASR